MPKIKMPKSAPSIDMTPMVDLAFLLVTFFMLSANFRSDEPVSVNTPASISDKEVPNKRLIQVTIDKDGFIYFHATGEATRVEMLQKMCAKYGVPYSDRMGEEFVKMSSFGTPMASLSKYLEMSSGERKNLRGWGIPCNPNGANELKDWILFAYDAALRQSRLDLEADALKSSKKPDANDYKPKFVLKVDGKAHYVQAKVVIETFRDLKINNLNFVTSLEENPYNREH